MFHAVNAWCSEKGLAPQLGAQLPAGVPVEISSRLVHLHTGETRSVSIVSRFMWTSSRSGRRGGGCSSPLLSRRYFFLPFPHFFLVADAERFFPFAFRPPESSVSSIRRMT